MIDKNKAPNHHAELVKAPEKHCKDCNDVLTSDNLVRHYGSVGYQKICKKCRNAKSLKYSRKKAQILKNNPLW